MMKKKVVELLIACTAVLALSPATAHAAEQTQNQQQNQGQIEQAEDIEPTIPGNWIKSGSRWWYAHDDGTYTRSAWEQIHGTWYYFDASGWMATGWIYTGGNWYYLGGANDGAMKTGWQYVKNAWYYMYDAGNMAVNTWIGDYYVNASGAWEPGKAKPQPQWLRSGSLWWYRHSDGSYTTNAWEFINGNWYYFDTSGWMTTGWIYIEGKWYYMGASNDGAMKRGWQCVNNQWYFMYDSGDMAVSTWVGSYYVSASGAWDPNYQPAAWIQAGDGRWWYRHEDGSYTTNNWECIDGKYYYFDASGWMLTNQWIGATGVGGSYVNGSGERLENGSYSIDGLYYTFDINGLCVSGDSRYVMAVDPVTGKSYKVEHQYATDPQVSEDDLLAAAVYAEAGNQQMPGMTGVALVMLNRMQSDEYPGSAACVIYQANQFQVARDGALTRWLNNINSATLNDAKTAVQTAKNIMAAYKNNGTPRTVNGLTMPEGKTDFNYLGFMTPAAFAQCNLDPVATEAFIYSNTEFYTRWITK